MSPLPLPLLRSRGFQLVIRSLHATSRTHRNVLARYAVPTNWPASMKTPLENYETSSTEPVATSVQAVPDPKALGSGNEQPTSSEALMDQLKQTATEVPAMKAKTAQEKPYNTSERSAPLLVAGVWIPVKPRPPGEEECCMSGCVNCVYTIYTDEVLEYNDALALASETLRSNSVPLSTWPEELRPKRKSGSKIDNGEVDADGVIKRKTKEEIKREAMEDLDPSLRAFLEMEARLKAKKAQPAT